MQRALWIVRAGTPFGSPTGYEPATSLVDCLATRRRPLHFDSTNSRASVFRISSDLSLQHSSGVPLSPCPRTSWKDLPGGIDARVSIFSTSLRHHWRKSGSCLHAATRLGYISEEKFKQLETDLNGVGAPLEGLIRATRRMPPEVG